MVDVKPYVFLPREEYDKLTTLANAVDLPAPPKPDSAGKYPAVEYARTSLAGKIVRARVAVGLTHRELAKLTGHSRRALAPHRNRQACSEPTDD
jgi:fermentation-respiration switch protein FrsA (DUF1100 family)